MKKIPVGYQSLEELVNDDCIYVDKTKTLQRLILKKHSPINFFVRPRRFGKTLALSGLAAIYEKKEELLQETHVLQDQKFWQGRKKHPILRLNFSVCGVSDVIKEMSDEWRYVLCKTLSRYNLPRADERIIDSPGTLLMYVIDQLTTVYSTRPVILIDEYDALLNYNYALKLDRESECCQTLSSYFAFLKKVYESIEAIYITGIMVYPNANILSHFNNFNNITFDPDYHEIAGFTLAEIESNFGYTLESLSAEWEMPYDTLIKKIEAHYNGYTFSQKANEALNTIYAGFSFCSFLDHGRFEAYWANVSGYGLLFNNYAANLNMINTLLECGSIEIAVDSLSRNALNPKEAYPGLLFYMGYLTIDRKESESGKKESGKIRLKFPNLEVKTKFHQSYLFYICQFNVHAMDELRLHLIPQLREGNYLPLFFVFSSNLHKLPAITQMKESHYVAIFQTLLETYFPNRVSCQAPQAIGTPDLILQYGEYVFIFEAKYCNLVQPTESDIRKILDSALTQIREKQYGAQFPQYKVRSIAFVINEALRNLIGFAHIPLNKKNKNPSYFLYPQGLTSMNDDPEIQAHFVMTFSTSEKDEEVERQKLHHSVVTKKERPKEFSKEEYDKNLYGDLYVIFKKNEEEKLALIKATEEKVEAKAAKERAELEAKAAKAEAKAAKEKAEAEAKAAKEKAEAEAKAAKERAELEAKAAKERAEVEALRIKKIFRGYNRMKRQNISDEMIADFLDISLEELYDIVGE